MELILTDTEIRILGALIEKEFTTPEYYPLSLNALINACNQKSNRSPVVNLDESEVLRALQTLDEKRLVWQSQAGRVSKYEQRMARSFGIINAEIAVLAVLMLRGPQTVGEIRGRSERIHKFADLDEVQQTLDGLQDQGYVMRLERQPGSKEHRWSHLFAGEPQQLEQQSFSADINARNQRIDELEHEVKSLRRDLEEIRNMIRNHLEDHD